MHGRVDPTTTLREQDLESVRHRGLALCLRNKEQLAARENLEHERRQVTVLSEQQQVLLVQSVDHVFRVLFHHVRVGQDRHIVALGSFRSLDPVHAETSGQTSDTTKDRLERLVQVVRNVVFKHLDHGDPTVRLVLDLGFTAKTHDVGVAHERGHLVPQRVREHLGVGIDKHDGLVLVRWDTTKTPNLGEQVVLKVRQTVVKDDFGKEVHDDNLRITFTTVAWLGTLALGSLLLFLRVSDLDNDDNGNFTPLGLQSVAVIPSVNPGAIETARTVGNGDVGKRRRRVREPQRSKSLGSRGNHVGDNVRGRLVVTGAFHDTVANHKEKLAFVGIVGECQRVECLPDRFFAFRVARKRDATRLVVK